jgi:hypothetical protein
MLDTGQIIDDLIPISRLEEGVFSRGDPMREESSGKRI